MENIFKWLLDLPRMFGEFGEWLNTPLDYIGLTPLALFGIGGLTAVIGVKVVRLFVGG